MHQELAACTLAWICRGVWEKLAWSLWRCREILLGQAIVLTLFEYPLSFNLWNYSLTANALHFIFGIMTDYKTKKKLIVVTSKSEKLMRFIKDCTWRDKKRIFSTFSISKGSTLFPLISKRFELECCAWRQKKAKMM